MDRREGDDPAAPGLDASSAIPRAVALAASSVRLADGPPRRDPPPLLQGRPGPRAPRRALHGTRGQWPGRDAAARRTRPRRRQRAERRLDGDACGGLPRLRSGWPTPSLAHPARAGPARGDAVRVVAVRMMALGIRHLPVVDDEGAPIGLLSARDLIRVLDPETRPS